MDSGLNVALVGYGFVGKVFHAPLIAATEGLHLHTVVSRQADQVGTDHPGARVVAALDQALADPAIDLVVIAAPNPVHASLAIAALDAGKHVVVDKPFTVTLEEARGVIAQAEASQRLVSVFQNRRWDSDFLTLRALMDRGELGEIAEFHSHFDRFRPQVADRWRERDQPGSGLWFDLGPHLLDQALQLFGMPLGVTADLAKQREGAQSVDFFHVVLRYARLRVILHGGSLVAGNALRFAVHGTRGSYLKHGLDVQESQLRAGMRPGQAGWGHDPLLGQLSVGADGAMHGVEGIAGDYRDYYRALRDAIVHGTASPVTTDQALQVMSLLEAAVRSACQRGEIEIQPL